MATKTITSNHARGATKRANVRAARKQRVFPLETALSSARVAANVDIEVVERAGGARASTRAARGAHVGNGTTHTRADARAVNVAHAPTEARARTPREKKSAPRDVVTSLWRTYRRRPNDDSRNRLVEHYQALVKEFVRRFERRLPRSVDRGDLGTAANVGLMSAIEGFDPQRGVRFESYCELRVRGALLDELRHQDWLPRGSRARLELQKRSVERLRSVLGREPGDEETAAAMEMPLAEYQAIFGLALLDAPISAVFGDDTLDDGGGLDVVEDTHADAPGDKLTRDDLLRLVAQRLSVQEYRLVYLKYWEELSMREIGELMQLSESRVSKIHARLLERLKDRFGAANE